ncbi:integral membrane protein [Nocardiopsis sp. JB363]|nr:integral membrane protein [Nocardiopsis sp. JB363]
MVGAYGGGSVFEPREQEDADQLSGEAAVAERLLDDSDFDERPVENVLMQNSVGRLDPEVAEDAVADLRDAYADIDVVAEVGDPIPSDDMRSWLLLVELEVDPEVTPTREAVVPMLEATADVEQEYSDTLTIEQVGSASLSKEYTERADEDFERAEMISIPVTFAILIIAFGSLIAAGVPVLLGISAVGIALGMVTAASQLLPAHPAQSAIILLMGLAVGVDYSLFYLRRVREEKAAGRENDAALKIAAATSGRTIVVAGSAVIIAVSSMFFAGSGIFSSLALGTIVVVAVAVVGALTVLPAVLSLLGNGTERLMIPGRRKFSSEGSLFWGAVLKPVLRAPLTAVIVGCLALGLLILPIMDMKLKIPGDDDLPRTYDVVRVLDNVNRAFPDHTSQHMVVVEAETDQADAVEGALAELHTTAADTEGFEIRGEPDVVRSVDGLVTKMPVTISSGEDSAEARDSLRVLRDDLVPDAADDVSGSTWAVGGATAYSMDFSQTQEERLPFVIGFVILFCFTLMLVTFRSVALALVTAALNGLSTLAAFGVVILVFQNTWAEDLLGFASNGSVVSWVPVVLFVVLFGLSMDYHLFVLHRIKEGVDEGKPYVEAIRYGVVRSAGVVTSAASIMIAVFAVFATLSTLDMKQLGTGLAVAVLLDATVIRGVMLPGALAALGRHAWGRSARAEPGPTEKPADEAAEREPEKADGEYPDHQLSER